MNINAMEQQTRQYAYNTVDLNVSTLQPLYGALSQLRYSPEFLYFRTNLYSMEVNYRAALRHVPVGLELQQQSTQPRGRTRPRVSSVFPMVRAPSGRTIP